MYTWDGPENSAGAKAIPVLQSSPAESRDKVSRSDGLLEKARTRSRRHVDEFDIVSLFSLGDSIKLRNGSIRMSSAMLAQAPTGACEANAVSNAGEPLKFRYWVASETA